MWRRPFKCQRCCPLEAIVPSLAFVPSIVHPLRTMASPVSTRNILGIYNGYITVVVTPPSGTSSFASPDFCNYRVTSSSLRQTDCEAFCSSQFIYRLGLLHLVSWVLLYLLQFEHKHPTHIYTRKRHGEPLNLNFHDGFQTVDEMERSD